MQQEDQFYYKTPELTHRYELIQHLLEYSNHLVLVQGEKDTGKTSLFNQLTTPDESSLVMIKLSASAHTNQGDILNAMVADMNATSDSFDPWGSSVEDFHNWLGRCNSKQQIPALLVDDVDLLDDELVDFIFKELCVPKDGVALHVCLFCEPSFLELAKKQGLEENESQSLHIIEMPHFNEKQTAQYLNHKYPDSESDLSVFDEKTVKQIHRISHGMPGRINVLADQYLNDPAKVEPAEKIKESEAKTETKSSSYNRAIIIVVVLLVLLSVGMAYILNKADEPGSGEIAVDLPGQDVAEQDAALPTEDVVPGPVAEPDTGDEPELGQVTDASEDEKEAAVAETAEAVDGESKIEILEPPGQAPVPQPPQIDTPTEDVAKPNPLEQDIDKLQDIEIDTELVVAEEQLATDDTATASMQEDGVESKVDDVTDVPVSTDLLITGVKTEAGAAPSQPKETAAAEDATEAAESGTGTETASGAIEDSRDINWLLEQEPNDYVLQLIGANEVQTIDAYLKSIPGLAGKVIRFTTTNNDKPWHVVVYGLFDNRQQAVAAIETLPELARATAPWPRPVKSIKELSVQQ